MQATTAATPGFDLFPDHKQRQREMRIKPQSHALKTLSIYRHLKNVASRHECLDFINQPQKLLITQLCDPFHFIMRP